MTKNDKNFLVSVIIPTFNRAQTVCRAIQSVVNQSLKNIEIIVVDDGSTDDTKRVIERRWSDQVNYIRCEENCGGSHARNIGIKQSTGKLIAFLDSDDEWLPDKLHKQVEYYEKFKPIYGVVYCLYFTKRYRLKKQKLRRETGNINRKLLSGWCPSITSSALIKSDILKFEFLFDETLPSFQDYDLWIRISKKYKFGLVSEHLVINHQGHYDRVSMNISHRLNGLEIFMDKWQGIIQNELGKKVAIDFYEKYLCMALSNAALIEARNNNKKKAFHIFKKLLHRKQITMKYLKDFLLLLIFPGTIDRILSKFFGK